MPQTDKTPIIQVENLTARFGDRTIFKNVSFTVYKGEILVVLGGSGCGKSTLLKHLIGLYQPYTGRVLIDGIDVNTDDAKQLSQLRRKIGVSFQSGALFGSMSVGENIALPLREYTDLPPAAIDYIVKMKLAMVNLAGFENHLPSELSGGMQKRAGVARAMALDPQVLFFDEPSAGLDPITGVELDIMIKRLRAGMGTTMVVVTHELQSIFTISDRIIMLDKSAQGIIAEGDPRKLKDSTDPRVHAFFNREPIGHEKER
uniref:ABC transporter ATP-binding protein n=1 Tax=Desulfobacca acetoxidans TaxID=60893 RepID=A0A7C3Z388_9BACT